MVAKYLNWLLQGLAGVLIGLAGFFLAISLSDSIAESAGFAIIFAIPVVLILLALPYLAVVGLGVLGLAKNSGAFALGVVLALGIGIAAHRSEIRSVDEMTESLIERNPELQSRTIEKPSRSFTTIELNDYFCNQLCQQILASEKYARVILTARKQQVVALKGEACLERGIDRSVLEFAEKGHGFVCAQTEALNTGSTTLPDALILRFNRDYWASEESEVGRYFSGSAAALLERIDGRERLLGRWLHGEIKEQRDGNLNDLVLGRPKFNKVGQFFTDDAFVVEALGVKSAYDQEISQIRMQQSLRAITLARQDERLDEGALRALFELLNHYQGAYPEIVAEHLLQGLEAGEYDDRSVLIALGKYNPPTLVPYRALVTKALLSGDMEQANMAARQISRLEKGAVSDFSEVIFALIDRDVSQPTGEYIDMFWRLFPEAKLPIDGARRDRIVERLRTDLQPDRRTTIFLAMVSCGEPNARDVMDNILAEMPVAAFERVVRHTVDVEILGWSAICASFDKNWTKDEISLALHFLPAMSDLGFLEIGDRLYSLSFARSDEAMRQRIAELAKARLAAVTASKNPDGERIIKRLEYLAR
ncbi:hypothetical protein [Dongia sp.]|uniref:hypothetical protein n=1 Tax=Dongia sp. TaxID=1977262 RepID=UPI0035B0006E